MNLLCFSKMLLRLMYNSQSGHSLLTSPFLEKRSYTVPDHFQIPLDHDVRLNGTVKMLEETDGSYQFFSSVPNPYKNECKNLKNIWA